MNYNVHSSVVDEFNTQDDSPYPTTHCASPQVYSVAGLQSLVDSPASGGGHPAIAATGVVSCLLQPDPVLVDVDGGLLTGVIAGLITECDQVDPGTGGRELS